MIEPEADREGFTGDDGGLLGDELEFETRLGE
jgi:hypothetical protein